MNKPIPIELNRPPVTEAIMEIRFNSEFPEGAVFGALFPLFSSRYPKVVELPVLQIPHQVREQDSALRYQPLYRLEGEGCAIQVNPRAVSLVVVDFKGAKQFKLLAHETYKHLVRSKVITRLDRVSVRYVNTFEGENIVDRSAFGFTLGSLGKPVSEVNFNCTIPFEGGGTYLKVYSDVAYNLGDVPYKGSVLDIDSFVNSTVEGLDFESVLDRVQAEADKAFFSVMGDWVEDFDPVYP